ncbi:cortexin-1 [Platysternon megacephalum]|uniref:Cortexin-1 n=1 Tax=Platysternon megacephalum TaxID=55544 RepID=A0A4D9E350_9SAUR|nr:cortexin-1 [Platysternon megacephalum]
MDGTSNINDSKRWNRKPFALEAERHCLKCCGPIRTHSSTYNPAKQHCFCKGSALTACYTQKQHLDFPRKRNGMYTLQSDAYLYIATTTMQDVQNPIHVGVDTLFYSRISQSF